MQSLAGPFLDFPVFALLLELRDDVAASLPSFVVVVMAIAACCIVVAAFDFSSTTVVVSADLDVAAADFFSFEVVFVVLILLMEEVDEVVDGVLLARGANCCLELLSLFVVVAGDIFLLDGVAAVPRFALLECEEAKARNG